MSIHEVFMPALSSTMTEGKIVSWVKSPGDKVEKGETVVVVESDKADMDVETFYEGYLAHIIVQAGETATVGAAIAYIAETEAEIDSCQVFGQLRRRCGYCYFCSHTSCSHSHMCSTPASASQNGSNHQEGRLVASPRARKLAKELKVDLNTLKGSGPYGRIVALDVEGVVNKGKQPAPAPVTPATTAPTITPAAPPTPQPTAPALIPAAVSAVPGQIVPLTTFQNAVVRNMVASLICARFPCWLHNYHRWTRQALQAN